ncbi:MAG: molybdate ABC transporter permease subunit [Pseudomonadota bacterium]|nr:molybdate ABC transporter permease subunit [Pseudomonadota bacterium]
MTEPVFSSADIQALWLTVKLAGIVTLLLLIIGTPLALWLSETDRQRRLKTSVQALVALPLVLPPTVLGFYLLLAFSPDSWLGQTLHTLGMGQLAFSFPGLVIASMIYSLPFVVQPLVNAFTAIGQRQLEAAATLGAGRWDTFRYITLPLAKPGFITAAVLGFAHTIGEFGVVLMIGGNIPGETRVASVQIYDHVEALAYPQAHALSAFLLVFSFIVLLLVYGRRSQKGVKGWL